MRARIEEIIHGKDTLGGILEIIALGVPAGLGSLCSMGIAGFEARGDGSHECTSLKGVEIGDAFENSRLPGTRAHDSIRISSSKKVAPQDLQVTVSD